MFSLYNLQIYLTLIKFYRKIVQHYGYSQIYRFQKSINYLQMSKIIHHLIEKYRQGIQKQSIQAQTSQKQKIALRRFSILAQTFISLIIEGQSSDEDIIGLSQGSIKEKSRRLLENASKNYQINSLSSIIGQYIFDEVIGNTLYVQLKNQLVRDPKPLIQEEQQQALTKEEQSILSVSIFQSQISHQIYEQNPHLTKVNTYLKELGMPQAQLTYLCQQMGWKMNFFSRDSIEGVNEVTAMVNFSFKKREEILTESYKAKQKRLCKMAASLKMLQKIYINFPQIWSLYEQIRKNKALIVPKDELNSLQKIGSQILNKQIQNIPQTKQNDKDKQFQQEKEEYLSNIDNFKSQQNLMIQHNPGIFTLFPIEKIEASKIPQLWKVKGEIFVNYNGKQKLFQQISQDANTKNAQKKVVQKLVTSIYKEYRQILQKMIMIKSKKSIKI